MAITAGASDLAKENGHLIDLNPAIERQMLESATLAVETGDRPEVLTGKRKVAIVGFAPTTYHLAPFDSPVWKPEHGCEIWGLNELYKAPACTRWDRWFDIHDRRDGDFSLRDASNIEWLAKQTCPVYMQEHFPDAPASVRYPREQVIRRFRTTYFTNSISYMLALAGLEGRDANGQIVDQDRAFGEVHLYGVDMAAESEYAHQRGSVEYFLGFLRGMGIKVYVPREAILLHTPFMYGYEGDSRRTAAVLGARRTFLKQQRDAHQNAALTQIMSAAATEGAAKAFLNIADQLEGAGKVSKEDAEELRKHAREVLLPQVSELQAKNHQLREQAAGFDGALDNMKFVELNLAPDPNAPVQGTRLTALDEAAGEIPVIPLAADAAAG